MHPLFILLIIERKFPAWAASFLHRNTYNPSEHNPNYFRETFYTELLPNYSYHLIVQWKYFDYIIPGVHRGQMKETDLC